MISTEPIGFFILGMLHKGLGMVLDYLMFRFMRMALGFMSVLFYHFKSRALDARSGYR